MSKSKTWWGEFQVPPGVLRRWRIGPSTVWLQHLEGEWRVAHEEIADGEGDAVDIDSTIDDLDLLAIDTVARFSVAGDDARVRLRPRLADRPVVTRPERPFFVPAGESANIFVSTPVWVEISLPAAANAGMVLEEFPTTRPSDTWFGPTPREGNICYGSRTACRLRLENLPVRPHRALSKVRVRNRTSTELFLERMQLPCEYLELYGHSDGVLWSQDLELECVEGEALAPLKLRSRPSQASADAELIAPARTSSEGGVFVRAFGTLFSGDRRR